MKILTVVVLFVICKAQENLKIQHQCKCRLWLATGHALEKIDIPEQSVQLSDKCDKNDFDVCAETCNQKISNETNGFDLDKPRAGEQTDVSLGQLYCNRIGYDIKENPFFNLVTLECQFEKHIQEDRNGTVVTINTFNSKSSVTRFVESGFKQKLLCVDNKYTKTK